MGTGPSAARRPELSSRAASIASLADWQSAFARDLESAHFSGSPLPRVLYELIASYVVPEFDEVLACRNWKWNVARWLDVLHATDGTDLPRRHLPDAIRSKLYGFDWNRESYVAVLPTIGPTQRDVESTSSAAVTCENFLASLNIEVCARYRHAPLPDGFIPTPIPVSDDPLVYSVNMQTRLEERPDVVSVMSGAEEFLQLFASPGSVSRGWNPYILPNTELSISTRRVVREADDYKSRYFARHYWLEPVTRAPPATAPLHLVFSEIVHFYHK